MGTNNGLPKDTVTLGETVDVPSGLHGPLILKRVLRREFVSDCPGPHIYGVERGRNPSHYDSLKYAESLKRKP